MGSLGSPMEFRFGFGYGFWEGPASGALRFVLRGSGPCVLQMLIH